MKTKEDAIERAKKAKEEALKIHLDHWDNLKIFNCPDDIPDIPYCTPERFKEFYLPRLFKAGAIPKVELVVGETYIGSCRNTDEATWNGKEFEYKRYKFGTTYIDKINHFEDDDGYDLFVPIKKK